jgi:hypothetical protein
MLLTSWGALLRLGCSLLGTVQCHTRNGEHVVVAGPHWEPDTLVRHCWRGMDGPASRRAAPEFGGVAVRHAFAEVLFL